jgi:hypothetical protein
VSHGHPSFFHISHVTKNRLWSSLSKVLHQENLTGLIIRFQTNDCIRGKLNYLVLDIPVTRFLIAATNCFAWLRDELSRSSLIGLRLRHRMISGLNRASFERDAFDLQFRQQKTSTFVLLMLQKHDTQIYY